jgi:hypothetical protein
MAKQAGIIKLSGTLDDVTFYETEGGHYARRKTSLDKKRVMEDAAFENSRKSMEAFGVVSKFCSAIYHRMPVDCKGWGIQQKMTGRARELFLEGKTDEEVRNLLLQEYCRR